MFVNEVEWHIVGYRHHIHVCILSLVCIRSGQVNNQNFDGFLKRLKSICSTGSERFFNMNLLMISLDKLTHVNTIEIMIWTLFRELELYVSTRMSNIWVTLLGAVRDLVKNKTEDQKLVIDCWLPDLCGYWLQHGCHATRHAGHIVRKTSFPIYYVLNIVTV